MLEANVKHIKKRNVFCNDDKIIYSKIAKLLDIIVYPRLSAFLVTHIYGLAVYTSRG